MRCYPPAMLQKTRSWAGGLQDGLSSRPHGAVLQRKQQMSDLRVWLQPNRLFLPRELWQVKRRNLHGLAFVHGGRGRCAPWCMAESGAVIYLLTKDCIKNKSWKVTSWMPCTCWAEGQGSCSFSVYEHRPLAQEMLNIKGHSLNCPTYLAGLAGRGLTPGCEDNMKAKGGSLLATCRFHSKSVCGAIRWFAFGYFWLTSTWLRFSQSWQTTPTHTPALETSLPIPWPSSEDIFAERPCTWMVLPCCN